MPASSSTSQENADEENTDWLSKQEQIQKTVIPAQAGMMTFGVCALA
jgi:hypothetical protein